MSPGPRAARRSARANVHVVVTAGPTREHVDPVRFLSNESSGKMGFEIARAAARAGHRVTLIAGPVHQETPPGVERIDVVDARAMLAQLRRAFKNCQALFMAAAVADWRPARRLAGKWRKKDDGSTSAVLELVRNPDLLASVTRQKGDRLVVGFALETADGIRRARSKLRRKNMDFIVLNDASALNAERATVTILDKEGNVRRVEHETKAKVARVLVGLVPAVR